MEKRKFCLPRQLHSQRSFCLSPSYVNQSGTWDFVRDDILEVFPSKLTGYSISCGTQKMERGLTASCRDEWLMKGGVKTLMSGKPSRMSELPFFAPKLFFLHTIVKLRLEIVPCDVYL